MKHNWSSNGVGIMRLIVIDNIYGLTTNVMSVARFYLIPPRLYTVVSVGNIAAQLQVILCILCIQSVIFASAISALFEALSVSFLTRRRSEFTLLCATAKQHTSFQFHFQVGECIFVILGCCRNLTIAFKLADIYSGKNI
jgi:hypothetical protein